MDNGFYVHGAWPIAVATRAGLLNGGALSSLSEHERRKVDDVLSGSGGVGLTDTEWGNVRRLLHRYDLFLLSSPDFSALSRFNRAGVGDGLNWLEGSLFPKVNGTRVALIGGLFSEADQVALNTLKQAGHLGGVRVDSADLPKSRRGE